MPSQTPAKHGAFGECPQPKARSDAESKHATEERLRQTPQANIQVGKIFKANEFRRRRVDVSLVLCNCAMSRYGSPLAIMTGAVEAPIKTSVTYAESADDGKNFSGSGNVWLSVDPSASFDQCAFDNARDDQWVDFFEIDFDVGTPGYDATVCFGPNPGDVHLELMTRVAMLHGS